MIRIASVLVVLAVLIPAAALAQPGTGRFEIYAGIYSPKDLDEEATFGLRAGCKPFERVGFDITAGTLTIDVDPVEVDFIFADLSVKGYLNSGGRAQAFLYAGPGWAFLDASAFGEDFASEDSFTAHIGGGLDVRLSDRVYVRPDVRGRWFEKADSNDFEWEASVALGFTFL